MSAGCIICLVFFGSASIGCAGANGALLALAHHAPRVDSVILPEPLPQDGSLEAKMARRFPQEVKVGDLIGLPVLDDDNATLGHVQQVVRSSEGKIKLIVTYSRWLGWFGRPVAVPIEAVGILGKQIASLEIPPAEYEKAPSWVAGTDRSVPEGETIRIALARR